MNEESAYSQLSKEELLVLANHYINKIENLIYIWFPSKVESNV